MIKGAKLSNTKLVIFDLDGTLYKRNTTDNPYGGIVSREVEVRAVEFISRTLNIDPNAAKLLREKLVKKYQKRVGFGLQKEFKIDRDKYNKFVWGGIDPNKYVIPNMNLKSMLISITVHKVIFSASPNVWIQGVLSSMGIANLFDCIFDSTMASKYKISGYIKLLSQFKVKPEEAVHVDDDYNFLKISASIGIRGILVESKDKHYKIKSEVIKINDIHKITKFL